MMEREILFLCFIKRSLSISVLIYYADHQPHNVNSTGRFLQIDAGSCQIIKCTIDPTLNTYIIIQIAFNVNGIRTTRLTVFNVPDLSLNNGS